MKKYSKQKSHALGKLYAEHILNLDDDVKQMAKGGSFWKDFAKGVASVGKKLPKVVGTIGMATGQPEIGVPALILDQVINKGGSVKKSEKSSLKDFFKKNKVKKTVRKPSVKMVARRALIKKIMSEQNLKMIDASRYIKKNNLKY